MQMWKGEKKKIKQKKKCEIRGTEPADKFIWVVYWSKGYWERNE